MTADFSHLKDGWYIGAIYDGGTSMTGAVSFHIERATSGVDVIDSGSGHKEIYDLNGRRLKDRPSSGIYIENGNKILEH